MTQNVRLERPWGNGRLVFVRDAAANDSDKTYTVPAGKIWALKRVYVEILATATVGARNLRISMSNATPAVIWLTQPLAGSFAATQWAGIEADTVFSGYSTSIPTTNLDASANLTRGSTIFLPELVLEAGYSVRVWESTATDPAADDMTVCLHYVEYDA